MMKRWFLPILIPVCTLTALLLAQDPARVVQPSERPEPPTINLRRTVTVDVVRKTKDAVVYISTTKLVTRRMSIFPDYPFDLGLTQPIKVPATALGSGFIVHPDGYVVTNNHVIDRGRQIKVELGDGRKLDASLISADPAADLAILKVATDKPLPALSLGDSSDLMIGEPVIAVGNPLGFSHSVSTGIVAAVHREIKVSDKVQLSDLIQTDAAINPGNSGGPLLNAYGQVIGINTAIRGDAQNIGFAIQVNKLRDMIPALLNPAQAAKLDIPIKLAEKRTISEPSIVASQVEWVEDDEKRYPIDLINGRRPKDIIDAYALLLASKPGESIAVKMADGGTRSVEVKQAAVPQTVTAIRKRLGVTVEELTPMMAQKLGIPDDEGILVTEVDPDSLGDVTGLRRGDVIVQVGIYPMNKLDKFGFLVQQLPRRGKAVFLVHRGEQVGTLEMDLGTAQRNST